MANNVVINGRFLGRKITGVDRFAIEILSCIDRLVDIGDPAVAGFTFSIAVPEKYESLVKFSNIKALVISRTEGQLWEQLFLPQSLGQGTLLLSLCNTGPIMVKRQVVVLHDAATVSIPKSFSLSFRIWYKLLCPLLGFFCERVLTVSEFSRRELSSAFFIPASKVDIVTESGEHILRVSSSSSILSKFDLCKRPYVFAVSSLASHKNFGLVVEALGKLENPPFDIAIAGGANARVFGNSGILNSPNIKWLGYVSDEELRALYESAMCFVFPSIYEGFGIPPLEAMNCGCPVLASHAASIPEVCGDAALYFNPNDADELAALLLRVSKDEELRAEFSRKGLARAQEFSWENAARQILDVCRETFS